jgi:predicted alpha/beta superfamily hydrolase
VVELRNVALFVIQTCRHTAAQAQGLGKALAVSFETQTSKQCAAPSTAEVQVNAASSETPINRPFVVQSPAVEHPLADSFETLINSPCVVHSQEADQASAASFETRTCRLTAGPSQAEPTLAEETTQQPAGGVWTSRAMVLSMHVLLVFALLLPFLAAAQPGEPIQIPRAKQYDLTSSINNEPYRVMVSVPFRYDSSKKYPVLYVLDGNTHFATASDAATRQGVFGDIVPIIVIGLGYQTEDPLLIWRKRWLDLTPTVVPQANPALKTGGADTFLKVIEEEIKPFVQRRYSIDVNHQALWGHSYGGLTVLRAMYTGRTSFRTFLVSSPSLWWDQRVVLKDEGSFLDRLRTNDLPMKILISSAAEEQYRGDDPKLRAIAERDRLIDAASEVEGAIAAANGRHVMLKRILLDGETHLSVSHAALTRSLRFAFPPP